ncbi:MAG: murein biosynthesis integral membrane protein MurJ [Kiritimatiellae bacterium]|nr:murein biosynthesis integral membrane protein MurJ [Kiritimatiellia bacterium]
MKVNNIDSVKDRPQAEKAHKRRILKSASIVSFMTGISRIGGLVREIVMAHFFGTSALKSAFDVAFVVPNLFRRLFGEGALAGAFVPVFNESLHRDGTARANQLAMRVIGLLITVLTVATAAGIAITYILPCFLSPESRWLLPLPMIRILLPYSVLICTAALVAGMLNSVGRFAISAFAPFVLNFVWIIAIAVICNHVTGVNREQILLLCGVILIAGLLQILIQLPFLYREGFSFKPQFKGILSDKAIIKIVQLMGPAALAMGVLQVNMCFDKILAYWIAPYAPAALGYAERLVYLPLGIFATAFMTVLLPTFSKHAAAGEYNRICDDLEDSLVNMTLLMMPCALGLIALALPVINMIYSTKGGAFDSDSVVLCSRALFLYAPGLLFFSYNKALTPAFYGLQDMKTPLMVSLAGLVLNVTLNIGCILFFPQGWKHAGIALSTVINSAVSISILYIILRKRIGAISEKRIGIIFLKSFMAALVMAGTAYKLYSYLFVVLPQYMAWEKGIQIISVVTAVGAGALIYGIILSLICRNELSHVTSIMLKRFRRKND